MRGGEGMDTYGPRVLNHLRPKPPKRPPPSMGTLLSGIATDAKTLLGQEVQAAKLEVHEELAKVKEAALLFGPGIGIFFIGSLLLTLMLVYGLQSATDLPLWGCYGIIGGLLVGLSAILLYQGKTTTEEVDLVPQEALAEAKEDVQWIKERVTSDATSSTPASPSPTR